MGTDEYKPVEASRLCKSPAGDFRIVNTPPREEDTRDKWEIWEPTKWDYDWEE